MWIHSTEGVFNSVGYRAIQVEGGSDPVEARLVGRPVRAFRAGPVPLDSELIARFEGSDCGELAARALERLADGIRWPDLKMVDLRPEALQ